MSADLIIYRRHTPKCEHRDPQYMGCRCPLWVRGRLHDVTIRESLKTRNQGRAQRKVADMMASPERRTVVQGKRINAAIDHFLEHHTSTVQQSTARNHRRILGFFRRFCETLKLEALNDVKVEHFDQFHATRPIGLLTWTKELALLRTFFGYCADRDWVKKNVARIVKMPRNVQPKERQPYTPNEIIRIIAACDQLPDAYSRLRARAMVLALRYTALRVSDVALLERSKVRFADSSGLGEIHVRTLKSGKPVWLTMHSDLAIALRRLPEPKAATGDVAYYFWSGGGTVRAWLRDVTRTLGNVFAKSGVESAHAHRFRHTLAIELLSLGANDQEVADILGNTPAIVRKHYAPWCPQRQERISALLAKAFGLELVQETGEPVSDRKDVGLFGGRHGIRTHDPRVANAVLSQLS